MTDKYNQAIIVGRTATNPTVISREGDPVVAQGQYTQVYPTEGSWPLLKQMSERHADANAADRGQQSAIWVPTAEIRPLLQVPYARRQPVEDSKLKI